jgi:aldehyde dehydrogenase (NAD+)/glyceraldehyde-3-phosphate dehydrogenase (NADP+)
MPEIVSDPRLPVVSFTGSGPVGWRIRAAVPDKHVTLELGGNGAVLVAADWCSPDDLDLAADRIATFSNYQAGQSCIAVQRVYVEEPLYEPLLQRIVDRVARLAVGDPRDPRTEVGPLIDEASARRVEEWVGEAVGRGASVCVGGRRDGTTYAPTVLVDVPRDARISAAEVFGPVLFVERVPDFAAGLARINDSAFGLQAGVLTHDVTKAFQAHAGLQVGGVVVGDVPSYRADQMPYGGTKGSGIGREGPHAAMEDLTEERLLVLSGVTL